MRCERCDQAERVVVTRAKMAERNGRVAVITGVPMEECPACAERWLSLEVAELLDAMLRRLIASGAETATAHWSDLAPTAA
jgi:YgiT-type zinc finger domain-containing protein